MSNILRSKYPYQSTTIYNVTASLTENFETLNIFEKIQKARPLLFPFDYPTPDNINSAEFKEYFETMFISKYIDYYFKFETFERFELALYSKMLEIMPVYNIMISNVLYNNKDYLLLNTSETITDNTTKNDNKSVNESKNISSKLPANLNKAGSNIGNVQYANDGNISGQENTLDGTTKFDGKVTTISGNRLDGLIKFDENFKNIFSKLMLEFKPLFSMIINY